MLRILYKYLILNKKASVPGIGVFVIERKPAKLDFTNKVFVAPGLQVGFKSQPSLNDNRIYSFISREQEIDESEAVSRYYYFCHNLKENLVKHKSVELPGMGVLSQNEDGQVLFNAAVPLESYFAPVAAERVIRENTEHHVLVGDTSSSNTRMKDNLVAEPHSSGSKDSWWIFAIALGIIGIATIVYYYLHNGSLH